MEVKIIIVSDYDRAIQKIYKGWMYIMNKWMQELILTIKCYDILTRWFHDGWKFKAYDTQ